MAAEERVGITVNGRRQEVEATPDRPLLEVLREDLRMAGTHYGCGTGDCGACAVLVEGKRTLACRRSLSEVAGKSVVTVEGLASGEQLHPVQQAFLEAGGFQCGYCTPGMMITLISLLNENPGASDDELLAKMDSNLCRCCGYVNIADAIRRGAASVREAAK